MGVSLPLLVALFLAGFLLFAAEVFLPGLVLGTLGFLCLLACVVLVFVGYGPTSGLLAAILIGGLAATGFLVWLHVFPRTFVGRRIVLHTSQPTDPAAGENRSLVGESGQALTPLRPSGTARIAGKRVDVMAIGEFLEAGADLVVVGADGMRVAVRRKDRLEPAAPVA